MGRMELLSLATLDVRLNPCPAPRELSATLSGGFPLRVSPAASSRDFRFQLFVLRGTN